MADLRTEPDAVALDKAISDLPNEWFQKSTRKALRSVLTTVSILTLGYAMLAVAPWYTLLLMWLLLGFALTGLHSIGHECSRGTFSRFAVVNSVVGALASLPLMLPYESWKIQQKEHKVSSEDEDKHDNSYSSLFWSSLSEFVHANFNLSYFQPGNRRRIVFSLIATYVFGCIFFPLVFNRFGFIGFFKFWLMPWIAYHFWMSTFKSWVYSVPFTNDLSIRFSIAFPTQLPRWVNFLTNDITYLLSLSAIQRGTAKSFEKLRTIPKHNLTRAFDKFTSALTRNGDATSPPQPIVRPKTIFEKLRVQGVNWVPALWICSTPLLAIYGFFTTPIQSSTIWFALAFYLISGLGITVGYHRLFAHRAFDCHWPIRLMILLCGTSAFEGSCLWWSKDHRAHHRYVDTDKDPYNSNEGFFWSHMGWLLVKQNKAAVGKADCSDLEADPLLKWQDRYYALLATLTGIVFPVLVAGFGWGDWRGGLFFAVFARSVLVHQSTFCVNSLAHYVGDLTFSDVHSPKDCYWVSLLTFGEGYHNFHHEFPYDFRNGVHWYAYDPSKWTIWLLSKFGLTFDLKKFPSNEIEKGRLQMANKRLNDKLANLNWGTPVSGLPLFSMDDVKRRVLEGSSLIVVNGLVHDVCEFIPNHPGGQALIKAFLGKDATDAFNGGVYGHSNGAKNLLGTFKIGRVVTEEQRAQINGETLPLQPVVAPPMIETPSS